MLKAFKQIVSRSWAINRKKLLRCKCSLPGNGDWIWATPVYQERPQDDNNSDIASKFDTPHKVLQSISASEIDVLEIMFARALEFQRRMLSGGDVVRDKAKALLNTGSFALAIIFGISSFVLSDSSELSKAILVIEIVLFLLLIVNLLRSLTIAMAVMTRELETTAAPNEFLSPVLKVDSLKQAIAQTVAYTNVSLEFIGDRGSRLILGQHSFINGLIYFSLFLAIHFLARIV